MSTTRPINPWFIAVTVTLATFMELLDTSIANVALPYIGGGQRTPLWLVRLEFLYEMMTLEIRYHANVLV